MLDLHVHVLPGIDDGPRSLTDAVALARALVNEGVRHVVATPHIYPGVFDNTLETIATAHATLDTALAQQQISLTLSLGAEVRLCAEMLDWLAQGRLPFLGGQGGSEPVVLVELPDAQIPLGADRVLGTLIDRGVTPLLAHPERNRAIAEQVSRLAPLVRLGCKLQVTAASLLGEFGSRAEKAAQELLDAGWVEVVASDAHNLTGRRPRLGAAREWLAQRYGQELAEALTEHNPARLARQGELAMQGIDGLTLRDLPRGHAETAAARAGPSLIDMLLELPSSAAAPVPAASEPTLGEAASKKARDPLHGEWSLTDFTLEVQAQAQARAQSATNAGQDADEALPPHQDFAEWTLPMTEPGELASAPAPAARVAPTPRRARSSSTEPPVLDERVDKAEVNRTAAAMPAAVVKPRPDGGLNPMNLPAEPDALATAAPMLQDEPEPPKPSRWSLLGWARSLKTRSAASPSDSQPSWDAPAETPKEVDAPAALAAPPAVAPSAAPAPPAATPAAPSKAPAVELPALERVAQPEPSRSSVRPLGISLKAFDDLAQMPAHPSGSRNPAAPPQKRGAATAGTATVPTMPERGSSSTAPPPTDRARQPV